MNFQADIDNIQKTTGKTRRTSSGSPARKGC